MEIINKLKELYYKMTGMNKRGFSTRCLECGSTNLKKVDYPAGILGIEGVGPIMPLTYIEEGVEICQDCGTDMYIIRIPGFYFDRGRDGALIPHVTKGTKYKTTGKRLRLLLESFLENKILGD